MKKRIKKRREPTRKFVNGVIDNFAEIEKVSGGRPADLVKLPFNDFDKNMDALLSVTPKTKKKK